MQCQEPVRHQNGVLLGQPCACQRTVCDTCCPIDWTTQSAVGTVGNRFASELLCYVVACCVACFVYICCGLMWFLLAV